MKHLTATFFFSLLLAAKNFFDHKTNHRALQLDTGDAVVIKSECENWYFGFKRDDPTRKGVFPKSYIALVEGQRILEGDDEFYKIKRTKIVEEITVVLNEWHSYFKKFYLVSQIFYLFFLCDSSFFYSICATAVYKFH